MTSSEIVGNLAFWNRFCLFQEKNDCYNKLFTVSVKMPKI